MTTIIQAGKEYVGVKMFENKKAASLFIDLIETIEVEQGTAQKNEFVKDVKDLFDRKITAEEGKYKEYRVTVQDLITMAY